MFLVKNRPIWIYLKLNSDLAPRLKGIIIIIIIIILILIIIIIIIIILILIIIIIIIIIIKIIIHPFSAMQNVLFYSLSLGV